MKWKPRLTLSIAMLHYIPVWAQFYNIPIELWTKKGLSLIASAIGKPLYADSATEVRSCVNFARICVEVDASHPLVEEFDVEMLGEDGSSTMVPIRVSYQWKPPSCSFCQVFGHSSDSCSKVDVPEATQLETPLLTSMEADKTTHQSPEEGWHTVGKKGKVSPSVVPKSPLKKQCNALQDSLETIGSSQMVPSPIESAQLSDSAVQDPILPEEFNTLPDTDSEALSVEASPLEHGKMPWLILN